MLKNPSFPDAYVSLDVEIADDVVIGPGAFVGPRVKIGAGTKLGPYVVIKSDTTIGKNNTIHSFASIGGDPQTSDFQESDRTFLVVGDNNVFHEGVTINRGISLVIVTLL